MTKIAIVGFDAGVLVHQQALLFFQKALLRKDRHFTFLGCDRAQHRCTTLNSTGTVLSDAKVDQLKLQTCGPCIRAQTQFVAATVDRQSVDPALDALNSDQLAKLAKLELEGPKTPAVIESIEERGVPIGRLILFDFLIVNKIGIKDHLSSEFFEILMSHLRDAYRLANFMNRVLSQNRFDLVFYVNGNTSSNAICAAYLRKAGTRCWSMEFSMGLSEMFSRIFIEENRLPVVRDWSAVLPYYRGTYRPTLGSFAVGLKAMRTRFQGRDYNSYTSPNRSATWAKFDGFRAKYQRVISVFLSSNDELNSHIVGFGFQPDERFFTSQIDWLSFIIENSNPAVGYVLRIHPRMSPNKRDKVQAPELARLQPVLDLARRKENFLVIDAHDSISSYYVIVNSTLTQNAWSTMALESVALGVPTVISFPGNAMYPIADFSPQPETLSALLTSIQEPQSLTIQPHQKEQLVKWLSIFYADSHLQIPVVRCADRKWRKIVRIVLRKALEQRFLAKIFLAFFRRRIIIDKDNALKLELGISAGNADDMRMCLAELEEFQEEARNYFGVGI